MSRDGKIAVVLGTRPEIIKMAEIVRLLGERVMLIHTGQHWDHMMSGHFMDQLGLPAPAVSLQVGGTTRALQIAETLAGLEQAFARNTPVAVMVQGDTNTVVGGALAANARSIPLIHVEAGLRSFDRAMPEEHNRIVTDHLADLCLAPTQVSYDLLRSEGIAEGRIAMTGNTIVGTVERALHTGADAARAITTRLNLTEHDYIVATIHRPENTDDPTQLAAILQGLGTVAASCPVIFPIHPRTRSRIAEFGLESSTSSLTMVEPLGYDEFVALCAGAALAISDSGGIQEEASVWKRPVVVLRRSTERPEVQGTFARLCTTPDELVSIVAPLLADRNAIIRRLEATPSPYGDSHAALRCVQATLELIEG